MAEVPDPASQPTYDPSQAVQLGQASLQQGNLVDAIAYLSEALRQQPLAETFLKRATAYLKQGNAAAAVIDASQAVRLHPNLAIAHHLLAKAYATEQQTQDAIAAYKDAARCYLDQLDKKNAKQCIEQVKRLSGLGTVTSSSPSSVSPLITPHEFLEKAIAKLEKFDFQGAIADLNWFLQIEPNHADALSKRAYVHAKLGHPQAALRDMTLAMTLAPNRPDILTQRGIVRLALGDGQGAVQDFTQLLSHSTAEQRGFLLIQRANAYSLLKQWDEAFKDFANALGHDPNNPSIYAGRGQVWEAMGDRTEAEKDYQQAALLWMNAGNWDRYRTMQDQIVRLRGGSSAKQSVCRIPIKYLSSGQPVVEVMFNDRYPVDMILDPQFGITLITPRIARAIGLVPSGKRWCYTNDGGMLELAVGEVSHVSLAEISRKDLVVAIADQDVEAVLGQDFLKNYSVRILDNEVELTLK